MKANITLKIEADLLKEALILAADEGTSISALLAGWLEQVVRHRKGYRQARRRAVARLRRGFYLNCIPPPPGMNCMSDKCFVDTNILVMPTIVPPGSSVNALECCGWPAL